MTNRNGIRKGSLQIYPRVRAKNVIPRANWDNLSRESKGLLGFLGYKVGMVTVWAKDNTEHSMTKNKRVAIPATIVECPTIKIYSVRFYKNGNVIGEVLVSNDKQLKKRVKLAKTKKDLIKNENADDIRVIAYSNTKSISVDKKVPDMIEIALGGKLDDKFNFVKENVDKELSVLDFFKEGLVDVRAVSRGFGTQGPVARFGIGLKNQKSEKGRRRPGSLGPWHPARVTFRTSQTGQTGYHSRCEFNKLILMTGKNNEKNINIPGGFEHYGNIKTDYVLLKGSIPGPQKRGLLLTVSSRPTKSAAKEKYAVIEIR